MEAEAAVARKNSGRGAFCGLPNPAPYPEWDQMRSLLAAQICQFHLLARNPDFNVLRQKALASCYTHKALAASLLSCSTLA